MVTKKLKNILRSATFAPTPWATAADIRFAVAAIEQEFLDEAKLTAFLHQRPIPEKIKFKKVGIVCAGNIPLVGFGDMFYALLAGAEVVVKPSRRDDTMRVFAPLVGIVDDVEKLEDVDALLVMGGDETCAALRARFPKMPMLLRSSRHSVAIFGGDETKEDMAALADDIFLYSGLGCRSVSHLFLPQGFAIERLCFPHRPMSAQWGDAYRYARAMATMRGEDFVDGGYYILKRGVFYDMATIGYSFYDGAPEVDKQHVQCIVGVGHTPFGGAQRPTLWDFADNISPLQFIIG